MSQFQNSQSIGTLEIVRHFWRRRWWIIILPPIFLVLSYLYIRAYVSEIFESSAMVMVRTPPSSMRRGETLAEMDPPVYEDIFLSDAILRQVIEEGREEFPNSFGQFGFEKQRELFTVTSLMTRDTAVQATYSPVLILKAKANEPEIAYFLMENWLELVLQRYGALRQSEAESMRTSLKSRYDELAVEAQELQEAEASLEQQLADVNLQLEARNAILAGPEDTSHAPGEATPGLYQEKVRLQLELSELEAGDGESAGRVQQLRARLETVKELLAETRTEVDKLGQRKVDLMGRLEQVRNKLVAARGQMVELRTVMATASVDAYPLSDPFNEDVSGDLILLSEPVLPELRIAPSRTLIALAVTAVLSAIVAVILLLELYVRRAVLTK